MRRWENWIHLAPNEYQSQALVDCRVPLKWDKFLII